MGGKPSIMAGAMKRTWKAALITGTHGDEIRSNGLKDKHIATTRDSVLPGRLKGRYVANIITGRRNFNLF